MTNIDNEQSIIVSDIEKQCMSLFESISGHEISGGFAQQLKHLQSSFEIYQREDLPYDTRIAAATNISNLGQYLESVADPELKVNNLPTLKNIYNLSRKLETLIKTRKEVFLANSKTLDNTSKEDGIRPSDSFEIVSLHKNVNELGRSLLAIREDHEKHDERHKKLLADNLNSLHELETSSSNLQSAVEASLSQARILYEDTEAELNIKKDEINKLIGTLSGTAIAGSYESNAVSEKQMADWLRAGSLGCMAVIFFLLAYSFSESTKDSFEWQASIFRMALAFFLSVPSAYLARESAKHRQQQYSHLQTSLDLRALNPFIASLPLEQQHNLKINIAAKVFGAKDMSALPNDPYPINAQELLMEIIKRAKPSDKE